jgi:hypothetical protein
MGTLDLQLVCSINVGIFRSLVAEPVTLFLHSDKNLTPINFQITQCSYSYDTCFG